MNPTWDLLPFEQLLRMLGRKTGQNPDYYSGWSRAAVKEELEKYEGTDTVTIKEVTSLNEQQMTQVENMLRNRLAELRHFDINRIEERFNKLHKEVIDAIAASRRVEHEVVVIDRRFEETERKLGRQHMDFKVLLSLIATGQNTFLVGPAGSGKTIAASNVAKALGLPFFFNGAIDNEYKLLGFTDAQGRVVHRPFREAYTKGGVYLFDEVDASLPSAVLAFNAALANDLCDFPDICASRHPDFYCMAAGNTFYGADHQYVGRMKQDAAFLDRFLVLDWHYDTELERSLALDLWPTNASKATEWFNMILKTREEAAAKGLQIVVSPRATIGGVKLLRSGVEWKTAVRVTLRKTMKNEDWQKIEPATQEPRPYVAPPVKNDYDDHQEDPYWKERKLRAIDPLYDKPKAFQVSSHGKKHKAFYKDLI